METIIKAAVDRGASDIHIKAGDVFRARIDGVLQPLTKQRLTPEQTKAIAQKLIPVEEIRKRIDTLKDYDCSWGAPGIGRFRVSILKQRSSFMVVLRVIPFEVPSIEKLKLPRVVGKIAELEGGLVLVTGRSGSGRSSTIASMIHHINSSLNRHVITLESPIEFLHRDLNSSITQREIGVDTPNYEQGLRAALRQDPEVITIGELANARIVDTALQAAENGYLVISTLHTPDVTSTISRMIGVFPPEEQEVIRVRFADALEAIISQQLLPHVGGGRCIATEILRCTPEVREMIRDRRRVSEVNGFMEANRDTLGTQTFEQHLSDLVESGVITDEAAGAAGKDA